MTIPAWGCLVLRRMTGKRPPQRSDEGKPTGLGVHHQAISSKLPLNFEIGPRFGRIVVMATVNGKCRVTRICSNRSSMGYWSLGEFELVK